jgi:hypothetical protein
MQEISLDWQNTGRSVIILSVSSEAVASFISYRGNHCCGYWHSISV